MAVKVQRPGVRAAMALDLFLLRKLAAYAKSLLKLNTDLPVKSLLYLLFQPSCSVLSNRLVFDSDRCFVDSQSVVDEWASSLFKVSVHSLIDSRANLNHESKTNVVSFAGNGLSS